MKTFIRSTLSFLARILEQFSIAALIALLSYSPAIAAEPTILPLALIDATIEGEGGLGIANLTGSTASWEFNDLTGRVTGSGFYSAQYQISPTVPGQLFTHHIVNLVVGGGNTAAATSFACIEGPFGAAVGGHLCGNYSFGLNFANESAVSYGPGTAFSRMIGGDDVIEGPQQSLINYGGMSTLFDGSTVFLSRPFDPDFGGYTITFEVLPINGSFDDGWSSGTSFLRTIFAPDSTLIRGWSVTAGSVDVCGDLFWEPAPGSIASIDMSGHEAGTLQQVIATRPGSNYKMTFALAGNPDSPGLKTLLVSAAGIEQLFDFDSTGQSRDDMGWQTREFQFVAAADETTLLFASQNHSAFGPALDNVAVELVLHRTLTIDIKPGASDQNAINPGSRGVIPVAILTTDIFDALQVDVTTLAFGPNGAPIAHHQGHAEDVDHDGDADLLVHFRTQKTGIACGDTEATLTGESFVGQPVSGSDAIRTVGCNQSDNDSNSDSDSRKKKAK